MLCAGPPDFLTLASTTRSIGHIINFMFVPLHWRVLYVNVLSMAWGTFMSKMGAKTSADEVWTPIDEVFGAVRASTGVDLDRPEAAVAVVTGGWTYVIASSARRSSTALAGGLWGALGLALVAGCGNALLQRDAQQAAKQGQVQAVVPVVSLQAADCGGGQHEGREAGQGQQEAASLSFAAPGSSAPSAGSSSSSSSSSRE